MSNDFLEDLYARFHSRHRRARAFHFRRYTPQLADKEPFYVLVAAGDGRSGKE